MSKCGQRRQVASGKVEGNWNRRSAVERLCGRGGQAVVEYGGSEVVFDRDDNFDYYLVNTDEFAPLAKAGSVLEVWTSDHDAKPGAAALVAGKGRLEVRRLGKRRTGQVLGVVARVESWPASELRHYVL